MPADASATLPAGRPGGRPRLAILVVGICVLVGLATPSFVDFDEAAYAAIAQRMVTSGDWLHPVWNGEPFYKKPALFYWLSGMALAMLGPTPVAPRLISLLATVGGLLFLAGELRRRRGGGAAEAAVWVGGASLLPFTLARLGILDALLTAALTVALLSFARALEERRARLRRRDLLLGYLATGVALATKGPAFPLLAGAILLADAVLRRDVLPTLRRSGLPWGTAIVLAVGLPWYVLAALGNRSLLVASFLAKEHLQRLLTPLEGHAGPPWYYLVVLALGLLPFSALVPGALRGLKSTGGGDERLARFAASWGAVILVAFSLSATKLPGYIAPAVPALAILVALDLAGREGRRGGSAWHLTVALAALVALGLASVPFVLSRGVGVWGPRVAGNAPGLACFGELGWRRFALLVPAAVLVAGTLWSWRVGRAGRALRAVRILGVTAAVSWGGVWLALGHLVQVTTIGPPVALARLASRQLPSAAPIYLLDLNHRASVGLATGRRLVFLASGTAADRARLRRLLAGPAVVRVVAPLPAWEAVESEVGGREVARRCGHVLLAEGAGPPAR
jgi:4-amino-4-deoxy-L-arabinose transferase-like glycosyltransferase